MYLMDIGAQLRCTLGVGEPTVDERAAPARVFAKATAIAQLEPLAMVDNLRNAISSRGRDAKQKLTSLLGPTSDTIATAFFDDAMANTAVFRGTISKAYADLGTITGGA